MNRITVLVTALLTVACHTDSGAWRAQLARAEIQRVAGAWDLVLRADPLAPRQLPPEVSGEVALTLNRAARTVSGFDGPPHFFGTYDVAFEQFGLAAGAPGDLPGLAGTLTGDSLRLSLSPTSTEPVELHGRVIADSIDGRWAAYRRAGNGAGGTFVMRRHPGPK